MITRLLIAFLAVSLVVVLGLGCGSGYKSQPIALQVEPPSRPGALDVGPVEPASTGDPKEPAAAIVAPPPDADSLARKTESYAKLIETAVAHRAATKPVTPPAPQPSAVEWLNPGEFNIRPPNLLQQPTQKQAPAPPAVATPVAAAPVQTPENSPAIRTLPSVANQAMSVAESQKAIDGANSAIAIPEPVAVKSSATLSPSADPFEIRITKRVKEYPRDISANLDYQLLLFLRDEPVPQLSSISSLPTEDRELVSGLMDGLSNFRNSIRSDNNMLLSRKIRPLTDLADRLRTQADMSIPTLALCTQVDGYGRYTPIDPPRFPAQREQSAIIYCELENFSSRQNDSRQWQTDVTQEAVLYTEDGMQVWADKTQQIQDLCRVHRHDFFVRTLVKFPATLTVGRYVLKVTIVDRQANRVAESSLPIQIVAQ